MIHVRWPLARRHPGHEGKNLMEIKRFMARPLSKPRKFLLGMDAEVEAPEISARH
jgi:hypothetical protein